MTTPICDFTANYKDSKSVRFHMPGHKGKRFLGPEAIDITEFDGADNLYYPTGIIAESERNASDLFGCDTFYSTEGSSLCIRAMLFLAVTYCKRNGERARIVAARNVHKSFINTAALLDFDILWLYPDENELYLSCTVCPEKLENILKNEEKKPCAVYITSPDYLGNMADISALADVCRRYGLLLLVDCAHGAYLRFMDKPFPTDYGADMCCCSAHKTLPVLTGGAYLHISKSAPQELSLRAKYSLAIFGSTSPSYLILQSLDHANAFLSDNKSYYSNFACKARDLRNTLKSHGFSVCGDELLKITLMPKEYGYTGDELSDILKKDGIVCEFHDSDHIVLMLSPENSDDDLFYLKNALLCIPHRTPIKVHPPGILPRESVMSPHEAMFAPCETLPVSLCAGRVLASASVGCPPAVPIVVCGERIDENAISLFTYYGVNECDVVKEDK